MRISLSEGRLRPRVLPKAERVRCPRAGGYGPFPGGLGIILPALRPALLPKTPSCPKADLPKNSPIGILVVAFLLGVEPLKAFAFQSAPKYGAASYTKVIFIMMVPVKNRCPSIVLVHQLSIGGGHSGEARIGVSQPSFRQPRKRDDRDHRGRKSAMVSVHSHLARIIIIQLSTTWLRVTNITSM